MIAQTRIFMDDLDLTSNQQLNNMNPIYNELRGSPMTILIGALCNGGNTIVLLSDRQTTTLTGLIFEAKTKGFELTPKSVALVAGYPMNAVFLEDAKTMIGQRTSIKEISDILAYQYSIFRAHRFAQDCLIPHGLLNFGDFHNKQKLLNDVLVGTLIEQSRNYNLQVELILGGMDERGHIFYISNPGVSLVQDVPGFCCAPLYMAGPRSAAVFELCEYSIDLPLSSVLSISFLAKKRSERLSGIGKVTDGWIIDEKGSKKINDRIFAKLEEKYSGYMDEIPRVLKKLEIMPEELASLI